MEKRRIGSYTCWGCHRDYPLYEGQRRRYCPACELEREKALAGTRRALKPKSPV